MRTYADSPLDVPEGAASRVFNTVLHAGELELRASDCLPGQDLATGGNIALFVAFSDPDQQARAFEALARDGRVLFPLDGGFDMMEDRFGFRWMLADSASREYARGVYLSEPHAHG